MEVSVCLVCLEPFQNDLSPKRNCDFPSFTNFLKFAEKYLQVSSVAMKRLLSGIAGGKIVFCENCDSTVISPICQVYSQLISAQARLSVELEKLQILVDDSTLPTKFHDEIDNLYFLKPFRSSLTAKCKLRRQEFLPHVTVERLIMSPKTSENIGKREEDNTDLIKTWEQNSDWIAADDDDDTLEHLSAEDRDLHIRSGGSFNDEQANGEKSLIKMELLETDIKTEPVKKVDDAPFRPDSSLQPNRRRKEGKAGKLKCSMCSKILATESGLKGHYRNIHQPTPCKSCGRSFNGVELLKGHWARVHAPKGNFPCPTCSKVFSTHYNMTRHKRITHNHPTSHESFFCQSCPKVFPTRDKLSSHKRAVHGPVRWQSCTLCNRRFKNGCGLKYHVLSVHKPKAHPCPHCEMVFSLNTTLKEHLSRIHYDVELNHEPHPCPTCSKVFHSSASLLEHCRNTHGEKKYSCTQCNKAYKTNHHLKYHINTVHKPELVPCPHCKKGFSHKIFLKRHITRLHLNPDHPCPTCAKLFPSSAAVTTHISRVHNETRYSCPECRLNYKTKAHLKWHLKTVHSRETHICHLCGKTFKNDKYLERHMARAHPTSDQKQSWPKCPKCDRSFFKKETLRHHLLSCEGPTNDKDQSPNQDDGHPVL